MTNVTSATGKLLNARSFNGSGSYVTVPQQVITDIISAGTWSFACWVKHDPTIDVQGEYLFTGGNGGSHLGVGVGINITNAGEFRAFVGYSGSAPIAASTATINDGDWHHVVATYDGTNIQLYVDNSPDGTVSAPSPTWSTANNVEIGRLGTTRYWDGLIDEMAIYDRALNATEVGLLWDSGNGTNPYVELGNALTYLSFDTDANDSSGNANNGTLSNGASISSATKKLGAGSLELDNDSGDQYVSLSAHVTDIATDTTGSIAFWFRLNEKNRMQGLVTVGDFGNVSSRFRIAYFNTPDELLISLNNGSWQIDYETVTGGFNVDTWFHVVMTQDGTASKLYINGEEAVITGGSNVNGGGWFSSMTGLDTWRVGARAYSDDWFLDGFVDECAYYPRALSATEARHLYGDGNGFNPYDTGLPTPTDILNGAQTWTMTLDGYSVEFWKTYIHPGWSNDFEGDQWIGGWEIVSSGQKQTDYAYFSSEPTQQDVVDLWDTTIND